MTICYKSDSFVEKVKYRNSSYFKLKLKNTYKRINLSKYDMRPFFYSVQLLTKFLKKVSCDVHENRDVFRRTKINQNEK